MANEDGGSPPSKPVDPGAPPEVTTQAFGEEDGGLQPPTKPIGPISPPEVTTLAIGEEEGGLPPLEPVDPT
uniref:Uncharacterized protein n=1 Tax=uncultured Thiotrichaceae bacterium TaxID=298394 RepID=A0A6S6TSX8_9GAMM|nr:MAG: Unknown protein [uncultured Thiotrichaceae bacterium]